MAPDDPLERTLFRVMDLLEAEEAEYFLTGSLVRNAFGEPRASRDLDVVVPEEHEDTLRRVFEDDGFRAEGPLKGRLGRRIVLRTDDALVDLWLAPPTEFHRREFERAVEKEYRGRSIPLMHPEDFVLRKLVNYARIRGHTEDLEDAYQVLLHGWKEVDEDNLMDRATFYRVKDHAQRLLELVREDREELEGTGEPPGGG